MQIINFQLQITFLPTANDISSKLQIIFLPNCKLYFLRLSSSIALDLWALPPLLSFRRSSPTLIRWFSSELNRGIFTRFANSNPSPVSIGFHRKIFRPGEFLVFWTAGLSGRPIRGEGDVKDVILEATIVSRADFGSSFCTAGSDQLAGLKRGKRGRRP